MSSRSSLKNNYNSLNNMHFINGIIKCMGRNRKTLLISWISVNFCTTSRNDQIGLR